MDHQWETDPRTELDHCKVCWCIEGSTTTECPGASVDFDISRAVYEGKIDFRNGEWCNQPAIGMSHVYGTTREPYERVDISKYKEPQCK